MKEESGHEDESKAPPTNSRSEKKVGQESDVFAHGPCLHVPGLCSDWLGGGGGHMTLPSIPPP